MDLRKVNIDQLKEHPKNPRVHPDSAINKLVTSIKEYGWTQPVLVSKDGYILAGHARCKAAKRAGIREVPAIFLDLEGEKAEAYLIADNRLQDETSWDEAKLGEMLSDLEEKGFDLMLTGFDEDEIDELINQWYAKEAEEDGFDVDSAKEEIEEKGAVTKPGDIWQLGEHRLMCGDSTDAASFDILMNGLKAQMCVTSPPYAVGKEYEKKGIEPWFETIRPVISNICQHSQIVCWQNIDLYCTGSQYIEPTGFYSAQMFAEAGFKPIWIRIWKKQGMNFGVGPYHLVSNKPVQQYEYITTFSNTGEADEYNGDEYAWISAFAGHGYRFVKRLTKEERKKWGYAGIWEINTVKANKEHPAMFPVELPWRCIKMHSDMGGIVLEPFTGSGTTIIAAEQAGRICYGMELSPVYCDVAVRRCYQYNPNIEIRLNNSPVDAEVLFKNS